MGAIATALQACHRRIENACNAAARARHCAALLAVSKTFPAPLVREAWAAGQRAFGESYVQEALDKMAALTDLDIEWHFIGPIQSNKTRPIAEHFAWVHGVDRLRIAERLSAQRPDTMPPLQVCLQVNISGEDSKSGVAPGALPDLARAVADLPRLRLRGLMAIPRPSPVPAEQRAAFRALADLAQDLGSSGLPLDTLSMGMSDDLEAAIMEGSTLVRVGTAIFGRREYPASRDGAAELAL